MAGGSIRWLRVFVEGVAIVASSGRSITFVFICIFGGALFPLRNLHSRTT